MRFPVSTLSSVLSVGFVSFAHAEINDGKNDQREKETLTKIRHEVRASFLDVERNAQRKGSIKGELYDSLSLPNSSSSSSTSTSFSKVKQTDVYKKLKNRLRPTKLTNLVAHLEDGEEAQKCLLNQPSIESKKNLLDFGALSGKCPTDDQVCVDPRVIGGLNRSSEESEGVGICVHHTSIPDSYWNPVGDDNDPGSFLLSNHFENEEENDKGTAAYGKRPMDDEEHHERRLQVDECDIICPGKENRPRIQVSGKDFEDLISNCVGNEIQTESCNYKIDENTPYPIKCWNTSSVTDMSYAFDTGYYDENLRYFNENLECWDVSKVTDMKNMFKYANYFNGNINTWDTSSVTDMSSMFTYNGFNQPIENWNVANVKNMKYMFYNNLWFYQNLDNWDVQNVLSMDYMFQFSIFNQNLDNWDVQNVLSMEKMFYYSSFNQCLSSWADKIKATEFNNRKVFEMSECPIQTDPIPGEGPWCQGSEQQCFVEQTLEKCGTIKNKKKCNESYGCNWRWRKQKKNRVCKKASSTAQCSAFAEKSSKTKIQKRRCVKLGCLWKKETKKCVGRWD